MSAGYLVVVSMLCTFSIIPVAAVAQECENPATVHRETPVYERPATEFNTASGWVYGARIAVLAPNIKVFICTTRTVRFGVISKDWSEIAYWSGQQWRHGWVVSEELQHAANATRSGFFAWLLFPIDSAHAEPPLRAENPPPGVSAPRALPQQTETGQMESGLPSTGRSEREPVDTGTRGSSSLTVFYSVLFVCMVLGMLAKVAFDGLTATSKVGWRARVRAGIVPIMVSPMVFLGIMKAADATAAAAIGSFISVACIAFQNGFFWHTVFDRSGSPRISAEHGR